MLAIVILSFVGTFAVIAPILYFAGGGAKANEKKQAAAALDSAIGEQKEEKSAEPVDLVKTEHISAIPLLSRYLSQLNLSDRLQRMLRQADLKWTPGAMILMMVGCFAAPAYLAYLRSHSLIFGMLVGAILSITPLGYVIFKRGQRFAKFEQGLPDALDLMVSALRVGHSFNSAMGMVTRECADPVGPEFRIAFDEQNYGLDLRSALENMKSRLPLQDVKMVVTAILIQRESGGNLAEVLEKTASVIRQRFRLKKQIRVHTAQGRMTGLILTLLPIFLGIAMYIMNPGTVSLLWTRPFGIKLLCVAAGLLTIGTLTIQKIVRMEV